MKNKPQHVDGFLVPAGRLASVRPRISYPFSSAPIPDVTAKIYERDYDVEPIRYTPRIAIRTAGKPDADPDDANAYLVAETNPEPVSAMVARVRRKFATVPSTQTVPSTASVPRPAIPGTGAFPRLFSSFLIDQPDPTAERYNAYLRKTVTSDTGVPSFYPTGGTYTLTFDGETTSALAYNASAADVETALNALSSVTARGSVTASGAYNSAGGIEITFSSHAAATATLSLTPSGASASIVPLVRGRIQTFSISLPNVKTNPAPVTIGTAGITPTPTSSGYYYGYLQYYLCQVTIDTATAMSGSFTVTIGGQTATIPVTSTQQEAVALLNALGVGLFVVGAAALSYPILGDFYGNPNPLQVNLYFYYYPVLTGGTYTVTMFTQTTAAIAWNATLAQISSAINALSNVTARGGCTITGGALSADKRSIDFVATFTDPAIVGVSSLTPSSTITGISEENGTKQTVHFEIAAATRTLCAPGIAAIAGDTLFLKGNSGTNYFGITNFEVVSADIIRLIVLPAYAWEAETTILEMGRLTKADYQAGPKTVACSVITNYYLPGVTAGITTAADIPIPEAATSSVDLLEAIFAATGSVIVEVGKLLPWQDSSILSISRTEVLASRL
jgi:hypothetical protein